MTVVSGPGLGYFPGPMRSVRGDLVRGGAVVGAWLLGTSALVVGCGDAVFKADPANSGMDGTPAEARPGVADLMLLVSQVSCQAQLTLALQEGWRSSLPFPLGL